MTEPQTDSKEYSTPAPVSAEGRRFDQVLVDLFPEYSRSRLKEWILNGHARLQGACVKPRTTVQAGQQISLRPQLEEQGDDRPEDIPLDLVYSDADLLVINKPAGLVVHPGAGNRQGTLLNGLLHLAPELAALPRAGIVHRLDKDTSGLMVVARSLRAHTHLVRQLQARSVAREYQAIAIGHLVAGGTVDAPIGRHRQQRKRMAVVADGREAITHYRVLHRYPAHTHIQCHLETGRTHQIRVHMAHLRHPLLGDPVYGGRLQLPRAASPALIDALRGFRRQALHACRLELIHPASDAAMAWEAPLPEDMQELLRILQQDKAAQSESINTPGHAP